MSDAVNWRMRSPLSATGALGGGGDAAWTGGCEKGRRCLPVVISQQSSGQNLVFPSSRQDHLSSSVLWSS